MTIWVINFNELLKPKYILLCWRFFVDLENCNKTCIIVIILRICCVTYFNWILATFDIHNGSVIKIFTKVIYVHRRRHYNNLKNNFNQIKKLCMLQEEKGRRLFKPWFWYLKSNFSRIVFSIVINDWFVWLLLGAFALAPSTLTCYYILQLKLT